MTNRPEATIVIPAHNAAATIRETVESALAQTHPSFEVVVVDDGSTDGTAAIVKSFGDPRLRLLSQRNRGLAGARNSGIAAARGRYVGFLDADDLWDAEKLAAHVRHLEERLTVGVSFSASRMIGPDGRFIGLRQTPKLRDVSPADILRRNPIGNGSAAVIRRETLDAIAWRPDWENERDWWFDETFRQSEDIECWMRIALTTTWLFEGIAEALTSYRINPAGLSANLQAQHASWERMMAQVAESAHALAESHGDAARAYQLRYLARRAAASRDGYSAMLFMRRSLASSWAPLREEPVKSVTTFVTAMALAAASNAVAARRQTS